MTADPATAGRQKTLLSAQNHPHRAQWEAGRKGTAEQWNVLQVSCKNAGMEDRRFFCPSPPWAGRSRGSTGRSSGHRLRPQFSLRGLLVVPQVTALPEFKGKQRRLIHFLGSAGLRTSPLRTTQCQNTECSGVHLHRQRFHSERESNSKVGGFALCDQPRQPEPLESFPIGS